MVLNFLVKLYFICITSIQEHQYMYKNYQSKQIQTGFRRKSNDLFQICIPILQQK